MLGDNSRSKIEEHIKKDIKSHIFKHLQSRATCFDSYNSLCFKIIDKANSKFGWEIKEAFHINWRKPNLNAQQNHLALSFCSPCSFVSLFFFCCFLQFSFMYCFHYLYANCRHLLLF